MAERLSAPTRQLALLRSTVAGVSSASTRWISDHSPIIAPLKPDLKLKALPRSVSRHTLRQAEGESPRVRCLSLAPPSAVSSLRCRPPPSTCWDLADAVIHFPALLCSLPSSPFPPSPSLLPHTPSSISTPLLLHAICREGTDLASPFSKNNISPGQSPDSSPANSAG